LQATQAALSAELVDVVAGAIIAAQTAAAAPPPAALADSAPGRVQEALIYLGFYDGSIDGRLGRRTATAISAFQAKRGEPADGALSAAQERALLDQATDQRRALGMRWWQSEAGCRFIYPSQLLPIEAAKGDAYLRFSAPSDAASLQVVTSTSGDLETRFAGLLGRYVVEYSRLRADWFVVSGTVQDRLFYDVARRGPDQRIIHLRLAFPLAERALWDPLTVILFNSFRLLPPDAS
jgi:hypothetical protein